MKFRITLTFLTYALISSPFTHCDVDRTMVLALSFDEVIGEITPDSSVYGLNGKVKGPKLVVGKFGKALEFNGQTDVVVVDDNPNLRLLDGGTLMAWAFIKTSAGHASWPRIMIKSNTNGGTNGYDFLFDRANSYAIRFCVGGVCNSYVPVKTEEWHHVAVTFDNKQILVYLDGENVGKQAQSGPAIDNTGSPLHIGNGVAIDRPYHGIFDEIRVWNRPLGQDEIKFQMSRGIRDLLAIEPGNVLIETWAKVKTYRQIH